MRSHEVCLKEEPVKWQQNIRIHKGVTFNPIEFLMMLWDSQPVFTLKMYDQVAVYPLLVYKIMKFTDELPSPRDRKQLQWAPGEEERNSSKPALSPFSPPRDSTTREERATCGG
jgi:hypothetical protein